MFFKQYSAKESTLSYFLGCGTLGKAVAVDVVAGDEQWFIEQAAEAKVTITHVIDTHVHADHYSGGRKPRVRATRPARARGRHHNSRRIFPDSRRPGRCLRSCPGATGAWRR